MLRRLLPKSSDRATLVRSQANKMKLRYCPRLEGLEDRLAPAGIFVAGADTGGGPSIQVFDAQTGQPRAGLFTFDPSFIGGVRVAVGDVTGDGTPDIIAAAGPGGGPQVKVYDGRSLALVASFFAFDSTFTGGVNVAVGDVNNDGVAEIITGAGAGGGPQVRAFDLSNFTATQIAGPLGNFMAYDASFTGGVNVASGNVDGLLGDEIITGAGPGGGPNVKVFGATGTLQASFFAYDVSFAGGVFVAAGDINNDQQADIITGAGAGGGPQVRVFSGADHSVLDSFFAYDAGFVGGVRVAAADFNDDGQSDIVTAPGAGGGPNTRVFDSQTHSLTTNLFAFDSRFVGGVNAAAGTRPTRLSADQAVAEIPPIQRLARFVPNTRFPDPSNWVGVDPSDSNLKGNVYVIAHGFAPYLLKMVQSNGSQTDPLKWWQTLNTYLPNSPGFPNSPALFYDASGSGVQITPAGLAESITLADPKAVVLAYSWIDQSAADDLYDVYKSEAYTSQNGLTLAHAVETALPTGFHDAGGTLHVIGHSHGSKVATVATVALEQTGKPDYQVGHLTLLDSPEDNSIGGIVADQLVYAGDASNNLWFYLSALNQPTQKNPTFVDNFVSFFGNPFGPIQGVTPLDPSITTPVLQKITDVVLSPGNIFSSITPGGMGDQHSYAMTWYAGAAQKWIQNKQPGIVINNADQSTAVWSPLLTTTPPAPTSGQYTQAWTSKNLQPQFVVSGNQQQNTVSEKSQFSALTFSSVTKTPGVNFDSGSGILTLSEDGTSTPVFTGDFSSIVSGISGVSFNFKFSKLGAGDQLKISVDDANGNQAVHFVMTDSIAGTDQQYGTISLGSLAHRYNATIQIQLVPGKDSKGASVTLQKMQEFTSPS